MSDTHRVIVTREALSDLAEIADYIHQNSPQNAVTVADAILVAIDSLGYMPSRFKVVGRSRKRGSDIHAMVVRPFIVYYRIDEAGGVYVLNIIHGARRQPRHFE